MADSELKGLRVAIYARFSSDGQREASIEDQIRVCRALIEARGGVVCEDLIFADHAVSGASMQRPEFNKMSALATCTPRAIDVIVAEDLSRIGRDQADLHHFKRSLEYAKVRLVGVADGIDTFAKEGELTFAVKSLISSVYLKDLRQKTMRGLEGRALAGYATGGVPLGYRTRKEVDDAGKPVGSVIEIDEPKADVVRRIFVLYLEGKSYAAIAKILNAEHVPPPRVHARGRRIGWKDSTIRAILHNPTYIGRWQYKTKEWRKVPGTNLRRPEARAAADVLVQQRPHLRIIDDETWSAVQARLAAVAAHYGNNKPGRKKGASVPGRATPYLFSSLLCCAECGSKMIITGGSSKSYYRCEGHAKRGICKNALSVPEIVVRASLLDELRRLLMSPNGLGHARKRIAERIGELARHREDELRERRVRLDTVLGQVERLVAFIADGGARSSSVKERLLALELEAEREKESVAALEKQAAGPVKLPTIEEVEAMAFDLEARLMADVEKGREELRKVFRNGRIDLVPQPDGFYIARSEVLPLVMLLQPPGGTGRYTASGCAGWI